MKLWFGYSEVPRLIGRTRYVMAVQAEPSPDERDAIVRHRLFGDECYASPAALQRDAEAESAFDLAGAVTGWSGASASKAMALQARGLWRALILRRLEASLSVAELLAGRSYGADDIVELTAAENAIRAGVKALEAKIDKLTAYTRGDEDLSQPAPRDDGIKAADWPRARR